MAQIVSFTETDGTISGTIREHSPGNPERFNAFNIPTADVKGPVTEEALAEALGIELTASE
jgi:hypothetical protein